jgi:xylulokinase
MSVYLGIDSGTQSTKAVAFDLRRNRIIAEAHAPHRMIRGLPEGHREQHPREWLKALDRVLREIASRIDGKRVRGIAVSGQQHGFVPLDRDGEVIRPAKLWCDTSTTAECELLTQRLGGTKAVIRKIGLPFLPGYTAPKILWLKRHEPKNYRRLRHVLLPHDYLNYWLTGNFTMEAGDASGTALLDIRKRRWSAAAIDAIDPALQAYLPSIGTADEPAGTLKPTLARRYGFRADAIVAAGGGDNMMGAIGTGNVGRGIVTASLGTSGTLYAFSAKPAVDPKGEIAAFCSSTGGWLPLLCTMNVTQVTERVRDLFGFDHARLERAAARIPTGAEGLLLLPYLEGERTPNLARATGVLHGLTQRTFTAGHLARAAFEGTTLGLNFGLRRLATFGIRPREVRLIGGGAKSKLWRQITADVFGVTVVCPRATESAALGAALQAAWCERRSHSERVELDSLCRRAVVLDDRSRCEPDPQRHRVYQALQQRHEELSDRLRPTFVSQ